MTVIIKNAKSWGVKRPTSHRQEEINRQLSLRSANSEWHWHWHWQGPNSYWHCIPRCNKSRAKNTYNIRKHPEVSGRRMVAAQTEQVTLAHQGRWPECHGCARSVYICMVSIFDLYVWSPFMIYMYGLHLWSFKEYWDFLKKKLLEVSAHLIFVFVNRWRCVHVDFNSKFWRVQAISLIGKW